MHETGFLIGTGLLLAALVVTGILWFAYAALRLAAASGAAAKCSKCLYPVGGLRSATCPECGHDPGCDVAALRKAEPDRVWWRMVAAGTCWTLLVIAFGGGLFTLITMFVTLPRSYSGRVYIVLRPESGQKIALAFDGVSADPKSPATNVLMSIRTSGMPSTGTPSAGKVAALRLAPGPTPPVEQIEEWLGSNGYKGTASELMWDATMARMIGEDLVTGSNALGIGGFAATLNVSLLPGGMAAWMVALGTFLAAGFWLSGIRRLSRGGLKPLGTWVFRGEPPARP